MQNRFHVGWHLVEERVESPILTAMANHDRPKWDRSKNGFPRNFPPFLHWRPQNRLVIRIAVLKIEHSVFIHSHRRENPFSSTKHEQVSIGLVQERKAYQIAEVAVRRGRLRGRGYTYHRHERPLAEADFYEILLLSSDSWMPETIWLVIKTFKTLFWTYFAGVSKAKKHQKTNHTTPIEPKM